jgi:hypothetical protein
LRSTEVIDVGGIAVTTPSRTAFDIGRHTTSRIDAVKRLDALANATAVTKSDVRALADTRGSVAWHGSTPYCH